MAPRGFEYPRGVELWTAFSPFFPDARSDSASGQLDIVARLRPGTTMEQGRAELDVFREQAYERWRAGIGRCEATARSLNDTRPWLTVVGVVVDMRYRELATARPRFSSVLLGIFAAIARLLAAVGIYAVVAGYVWHRRREIGIRLALGARPGDVRRMVLGEGLAPALAGTAAGLAMSLAAMRLLESQLYGVRPTDMPTLLSVIGIVVSVAVVACLVPARQATKVNPVEVMRVE